MEFLAPAKINLSLRIKGRRADGFHEIETLMAPVSLADRLTIEEGRGLSGALDFSCDDASLPTGDDNLVVRAVRLFREATCRQAALRILLKKSIPHGAGLGGGSSDGATTLLGLNELFETKLTQEQLIELASRLGSDVPFFVLRSAALCQGRGEIVTARELPNEFALLLVKPDFAVPTPWAYARWKESRELPGVAYTEHTFAGVNWVNDLERPVFEKFIFLANLKTWLREQPEVGAALLSGSGSTVFAVLRDSSDAPALKTRLQREIDPSLWTFACAPIRQPFGSSSPARIPG